MISRFLFNISFNDNIKNIFKLLSFREKNEHSDLEKKLSIIFNNSEFYFFDYGRTAFYEILNQIKKKTKKRKILVNSFTLFEVINVIIYCGFEPIFIDNKKKSFNSEIDLNNYKEDIDNIAVVLVTHLNGININIHSITNQINEHNKNNKKIYLVEDCAVSLGSEHDSKKVGTFGDYSFLSFNLMKNITSYTGGILVDNLKDIKEINAFNYKRLSKFDIFGKIIFALILQILNSRLIFPIFFQVIKISYKFSINFFLKKYRTDFNVTIQKKFPSKFCYFMHPFQKSILIDQFNNMQYLQELRIKKSEIYFNNLKNINELSFPQTNFTKENIFLDFPILCSSINEKNRLFDFLLKKNIDVKNYYYKNCSEEKIYNANFICKNSKAISDSIIMLPVHKNINVDHQNLIIQNIKNFFNK
mgnify:CR=1 FL=1|tara:strand:- start:335 stop:1582 length:1248 start_codon:yes stop_codon:yes gene_type:complete